MAPLEDRRGIVVVVAGVLFAACPALPPKVAAPAAPDEEPDVEAPSLPENRSAYVLTVVTDAKLPVYRPQSDLERMGVEAALAALDTLGEGGTVGLILQAAPHLMNVSPDEGEAVRKQLEKRYEELENDELWADVDSPLPSAFKAAPPPLLVAPPRDALTDPKSADVVLFLHGYGGNGKLFAWLLSRALPTMWVLAPSHGLTWRSPNLAYLEEVLSTFEEHTGRRPARYFLVGLSDGAVGSFEVLAAQSRRFAALVSLVGVPREGATPRLPTTTPMLWLNGRRDRFVAAKTVETRFEKVKARVPRAALEWTDGGHYFLLDDDGAALERTRAFLTRSASSRR